MPATMPASLSKNCLFTSDQPPTSLMVNSPDGVGKSALAAAASSTGR
jgi:hypothetical protein